MSLRIKKAAVIALCLGVASVFQACGDSFVEEGLYDPEELADSLSEPMQAELSPVEAPEIEGADVGEDRRSDGAPDGFENTDECESEEGCGDDMDAGSLP
ncbi:MAG TPA: hypothetical protein PLY45_04645 [bacterium]|nr:hypothetical protein [bacterium]